MKYTIEEIKEGQWEEKVEPAENELHLEKGGMLSGLTSFKVGQVDVGKPIAGLVVAAANDVLAGLVQRVAGGQPSVAGRFAGAIPGIVGLFVLNTKTAKGWLGSDAVDAGNIVLLADLITDYIFDIRKQVSGLVGGVKFGQTMRGKVATGGNGHKEITSIEEYNLVHGLA